MPHCVFFKWELLSKFYVAQIKLMTTGRFGPEGLQNLQLLHPTSFSCYTHTVTAEEGLLGRNICCQLFVPHKFAQQFPFEEGLLCNHAHLNTHDHAVTVTPTSPPSQTPQELPECPPPGSLQRPPTCPAVPLS